MSEAIEPHISRKYEIVSKLGKGAYGNVLTKKQKKHLH